MSLQPFNLPPARIRRMNPRRVNAISAWWRHIWELAMLFSGDEQAAQEITANTFLDAVIGGDTGDQRRIERAFCETLRRIYQLEKWNPHIRTNYHGPDGRVRPVCVGQLRAAVMLLPPTERLIYILCCAHDYGHEYVGQLMELAPEDVKLSEFAAALRIRELLAEAR